MAKEIEKKFVLAELPQGLPAGQEIRQGYLMTEGGELRLRAKAGKYYLTVKSDGSLSRDEWESEIPAWVFETLWPQTEGRQVEKIRYAISYGTLTLEVDKYFGQLEGLLTLECELPAETAAFELPEWADGAPEVTNDKRYKNKSLATEGLPR